MQESIEHEYYPPAPQTPQPARKSRYNTIGRGKNTFFIILVTVLVGAVILGGYHLPIFLMDLIQKYAGYQDWLANREVLAWVVTGVILIGVFFGLRYASQTIAEVVKSIFKIGQYDVVTMIIAIAINVLFMMLAGWMTHHIMNFIDSTQIPSFFEKDNFFSTLVMFTIISGSMIWFPRTGDRYSENKFGQIEN